MLVTAKDEESALVLRRHPSSLVAPFLKATIPAIIGIILLFHLKGRVSSALSLFLVFLAISYALYEFVIWYYDIVVITKTRLVDVNQRSLFSREIKEVPINKISNIMLKTTGLLGAIFGFGNVVVSSSFGEFVLEDLKNPQEVKNILEKLSQKSSLSANELIEFIVKAKQRLK